MFKRGSLHRLESINKVYGTHILVSETVYEKVKDKFLFRIVDVVAVKGKQKGIHIYQMIGKYHDNVTESVTPQDISVAMKTRVAFEAYLKQKWGDAERFYHELLVENPEDKIAALYLTRIEEFKKNPPDPSWDGVTHLTTK